MMGRRCSPHFASRKGKNNMPKLTKKIYGAPEGEVYPKWFEAGDDCPPELETAALSMDALETKAAKPANKGSK
jgi:hypothetical protein